MRTAKDLKEHEKQAVEELRKRLKDDMEPDLCEDEYLFLRFLRARDFDIDNAEAMLRKHLAWREKYNVKNALTNFKKIEFRDKYVPNLIIGHDKEGCVVRFAAAGTIDFIGLLKSLKFEEIAQLILYETETETEALRKQSEKLGRNVDKCVYIYDTEHLTFAQTTDRKVIYNLIFLLKVFVDNYPERLKAAYVINVPNYFYFLFSILKTILPMTVLNKIRIYNDDSYKQDLSKGIAADVLPAFLGGNRTDPDGNPLCLTLIKRGEPVPERYFLRKNKRTLSKSPGVQRVTLSRAAFHEVNLEVSEPGSCLEWEFETRSRDIGFGLFFQEGEEEKITEIVPIQRIDTDLCSETGMFRCEKPGTYVIVFDNTYSWVRAKEIYFRTKLVTPEEHEAAQIKE